MEKKYFDTKKGSVEEKINVIAKDETTMESTLKHALIQSEDYWGEIFDICASKVRTIFYHLC